MQHAEQGKQVAARDLPTERAGMKDIVERLRNWRTVHLTQLRYLMESAADEIERLRLSARADCPEPENAANEEKVSMRQNMTTLTSQERDVLREVCRVYADEDDVGCNEIAYVIDRILERSRTGSNDANVGEDAAKCAVKGKELPERERLVRSLEARLEELRAAADKADAEYRAEIARLREEKAADWKAACESTRLASTEIDRLRSRLRFADAVIRSGDVAALASEEREAVERARDLIASTMPYESVQGAADWKALSGLLERLRGGR